MASSTPKPRRCLYRDDGGSQCRRYTITDNDYCMTHQIHSGQDVQEELASVLAKVDNWGNKQDDLDARQTDLATREASLAAREGRINDRDADLTIREWGLHTRERNLNRREAELNTRSRDTNRYTEEAEDAAKCDEHDAYEENQDLAFENVTLRNWLTEADADLATALENIQRLETRSEDHDSETVAHTNKIAALESGLRRMTVERDTLLAKNHKLQDAFDAKWTWTYGNNRRGSDPESSADDSDREPDAVERATANIDREIQARIDKVRELGDVIRAARDQAHSVEGKLSAAQARAEDAERKAESSEAKYEAYRSETRRLKTENKELKDRNIELVVQAAEERIWAAEVADRVGESSNTQTTDGGHGGAAQLAAMQESEAEADGGNTSQPALACHLADDGDSKRIDSLLPKEVAE